MSASKPGLRILSTFEHFNLGLDAVWGAGVGLSWALSWASCKGNDGRRTRLGRNLLRQACGWFPSVSMQAVPGSEQFSQGRVQVVSEEPG